MLLVIAGFLNVLAPAIKYLAADPTILVNFLHVDPEVFAAIRGPTLWVSQFLQGAAYGVIGAWPAMLAMLQWPRRMHTGVIAVASLSNYIGGAVGVLVVPLKAPDAIQLQTLLRIQTFVCVGLAVLISSWFWIRIPEKLKHLHEEEVRGVGDGVEGGEGCK